MIRNTMTTCAALLLVATILDGCESLGVHDTSSVLVPRCQGSEIFGGVASVGTTCAAVPDLIGMLKRRPSADRATR
jgi:hypothetical protein